MSLISATSSAREEAQTVPVVEARSTPRMLHSQARYDGNGTQVNGKLNDKRVQTLEEVSSGTFNNSVQRTEIAAGTINIHNYYYASHGQGRTIQGPPQDAQPQSSHVARRNAGNLSTDRQGVLDAIISTREVVSWLCSSCLRYVR